MDIFMSFPSILLSLLIGIALGPSILNMCLSLGIPLIPAFYRVTRGAALNVGGENLCYGGQVHGHEKQ